MKNVFINSNDRLFMAVRPYTGKYSVKDSRFFEEVRMLQERHMEPEWCYRPLNMEIEITDKCNQACKHCGMAANGMKGISYTAEELKNIIFQLSDLGIPSYSVTGGEPFIEFENMLMMFQTARGKVDLCKLTSNGFWGADAADYFDKMCQYGLLGNRFFVPCLMLSIGEQSTPIKDICNIIHFASENFSKQELNLCISSLSEYGQAGKKDEFMDTYYRYFGELPEDRIFMTENYYRNSVCMKNFVEGVDGRNVSTYMHGPVRCFEQTIGKYVLPRMLVKANGDVATCACFNPPEDLRIGNIKKQTVREVLTKINSNIFVRIIAEDGLHNFRHWIDEETCRNTACSNECEACAFLIHAYKRKVNEERE